MTGNKNKEFAKNRGWNYGKRANVTKFAIAGVKLGMKPDEAVLAIRKFYGEDSVEIANGPNASKNHVTGEEFHSSISFKSGQVNGRILITPHVPKNGPTNYAVSSVSTGISGDSSNTFSLVREKYGPPTTIHLESATKGTRAYYWCRNLIKEKCNVRQEPQMKFSGGSGRARLSLIDPRYIAQYEQHLARKNRKF